LSGVKGERISGGGAENGKHDVRTWGGVGLERFSILSNGRQREGSKEENAVSSTAGESDHRGSVDQRKGGDQNLAEKGIRVSKDVQGPHAGMKIGGGGQGTRWGGTCLGKAHNPKEGAVTTDRGETQGETLVVGEVKGGLERTYENRNTEPRYQEGEGRNFHGESL